MWSKISVSFPAWEVEMQMRVTGPGRRGALGMVSGPYSSLLGGAGDKPQASMSFRVPDLCAGNLQAMWYIQDRDQVSSVPEGLVSWDGIRIFFDSSANDVQVGSHLLPILLSVLSLTLTLLMCLRLRLIVTSQAEQPCHPSAGQ